MEKIPKNMQLNRNLEYRLVGLGVASVGKSSLIIRHCLNTFPEDYIPTLQDLFRTTFNVDG